MKVWIFVLLAIVSEASLAEGCVDSVVFTKKADNCVALPQNTERKEKTVLKGVTPSKTVLEQAIADRMLVFATNAQPSYNGMPSTERFGIEFGRSSVRLGFRKSF